MKPDDELCLCFHVTWRKVLNFLRVHKIRHASQLSECYGAGTGCGWCRKQLIRLTETVRIHPPDPEFLETWLLENSPGKQSYSEGRQKHIAEGRGQPPKSSDPNG